MKIDTVNKGVLDTNNMSDGQAEIVEESVRFKKFLHDRNGEFFIWMKIPGRTAWASMHLTEAASVVSVVTALNLGVSTATQNEVGVVLAPMRIVEAIRNGDF